MYHWGHIWCYVSQCQTFFCYWCNGVVQPRLCRTRVNMILTFSLPAHLERILFLDLYAFLHDFLSDCCHGLVLIFSIITFSNVHMWFFRYLVLYLLFFLAVLQSLRIIFLLLFPPSWCYFCRYITWIYYVGLWGLTYNMSLININGTTIFTWIYW